MTEEVHSSMNKVELNFPNRQPLEWMGLTSTIPLAVGRDRQRPNANFKNPISVDVLADDRLPVSIADVL